MFDFSNLCFQTFGVELSLVAELSPTQSKIEFDWVQFVQFRLIGSEVELTQSLVFNFL